jgi:hypothetical protein
MYIYKKIRVKLNERVVAFRNGLPVRALGAGRHIVWGTKLSEQRWETDALTFNALPEIRALLPEAWFAEVAIADNQRGILYRDGKARVFLRPGVHRYWTVDPSVQLKLFSVDEPRRRPPPTSSCAGKRRQRPVRSPTRPASWPTTRSCCA